MRPIVNLRGRLILALLFVGTFALAPHAAGQPVDPERLSASISGSTVTLTWEWARGCISGCGGPLSGYVIEVGSRSGASDLGNIRTGSTATLLTATHVSAGTYYVRVRAMSLGPFGASLGTSNEVVVIVGGTTCSGAPGPPAHLNASVSGSTVTLTWRAPFDPVSAYRLEAGSAGGLANLATMELSGAATTYTAPGVPDGIYFVRLKARNPCGTSYASNEGTLMVGGGVPGQPFLQIVPGTFHIYSDPSRDRSVFAGLVQNVGTGTASFIRLLYYLFDASGEGIPTQFQGLARGSAIVRGRSRRLTRTRMINHETLAPGEVGCFVATTGNVKGVASVTIEFTDPLRNSTFDTFPTSDLQGRLRSTARKSDPYFNGKLFVDGQTTNIGSTVTYGSQVAWYAVGAFNRALDCQSTPVWFDGDGDGFAETTTMAPGQTGYTTDYAGAGQSPAKIDDVVSLVAWPQWEEKDDGFTAQLAANSLSQKVAAADIEDFNRRRREWMAAVADPNATPEARAEARQRFDDAVREVERQAAGR